MAERNFDKVQINVNFKEAASRQSLDSGDSVNKLFGKVKKWLTDLKSVAFSGSYNDLSDKPNSLPANGGDADTVNNHTVNSDVPTNAVFTDTWRGIQDNLTSDSTTDSLSANQGKILNEKVEQNKTDISQLFDLSKGNESVNGNSSYTIENTVDYPLIGLGLYGKSIQGGTPTQENPVEIISAGENGFDIISKNDKHFNLLSVRDNGGEIITKQPVSVVGNDGDIVRIPVAASGTGLKYQWQFLTKGSTTWKNSGSAGSTTDTIRPTLTSAWDGAHLRCVITDANGKAEISNDAVIYVVSDDCEINTASITASLPLCGIPVSSGGNYTDSSGQQWVCDELIYNADGSVMITKRTAKIDSYNSEAVSGAYISTTGSLTTGATVIYQLDTPQEIQLAELNQLQTFNGTTSISNSGGAEMAVKYCTSKMLSECVLPITMGLQKQDEILNKKIIAHTDNSNVHVTTDNKLKWNGYDQQIKQNSKKISACNTNLQNLYDVVLGKSYTFETDSTTAYSKPVPVGARLAGVKKIGGRTICFNQLFDPSYVTEITLEGIHFTNNNGIYAIEGTVEGSNTYCNINYSKDQNNCSLFQGHKYLCKHDSDSGNVWLALFAKDTNGITRVFLDRYVYSKNQIFTVDYEIVQSYARIQVTGEVGTAISETITPMLFDLTKMFGAGNEPETVEEFEAMFPDAYYPYSEGELMASPVTALHSTIDGTTVERTQIPDEIIALEGYGDGINAACCNYVDLEAKKYYKCVGVVDLGTLDWSLRNTNENGVITYSANISENVFKLGKNGDYANAVHNSSYYGDVSFINTISLMYELDAAAMRFHCVEYIIYANSITYTDAASFKAAMSGVILYYELETPIATDISDMLTADFNILDVMTNGQFTFENENKIAVPSEVEYVVDLMAWIEVDI